MYRILDESRKRLSNGMVAFAQELVRIPSVSLDEGHVADRVEREMKILGYDEVFRDGVGNVIGLIRGRQSESTVLLNSHMDTVPVGKDSEWHKDPLGGVIERDLLHGVGAADCKGGLAAQVYTGAMLKESLLPLRGNLVVAATVAEENGLSIGVKHLIEQTLPELELAPNFSILGEPTGLNLYYGHDGWVDVDVRIEGTNPFQVEDTASAILKDLRSREQHLSEMHDREVLAVGRSSFENGQGLRRATIQLARRLSEYEESESVVGEMQHTLAALESGDVMVAVAVRQEQQQMYSGRATLVRRVANAWATDPFSPVMTRARHALSASGLSGTPGKWRLNRLGMGTAGSVLVQEFGIPAIGYGPGSEAMAHAVGECVPVRSIMECAYGTAAIVHSLIGVPVCGWTSDEI